MTISPPSQIGDTSCSSENPAPVALGALARRQAERRPEGIAFYELDGSVITFAAIVEEAEQVAAGLAALGIVAGDTISFQLPNWRESVAINLAASMLALRVNPITPIYRGAELRVILKDAGSKLIFIPEKFRSIDYCAMIDELRPDLPNLRHILTVRGDESDETSYEWLKLIGAAAPVIDWIDVPADAPKLLLYTSGTTGRAKGVVHTHDSMHCFVTSAADYWGLDESDLVLMASPVTHITGYGFALELPFACDTRVVLMERWDPVAAIELIERLGVTISIGATPFLKELVDEAELAGNKLPSMRLFACGGASVPSDLILRTSRVTERCQAFRVYGATEVPLVTKGFIEPSQRLLASETDGRVVGYEVKVVAPDGRALPRGATGEIRARGPAMLACYTDPNATSEAFDEEGYFLTGDLGKYTEDGAIVVTGRLKDIIIRGGENLSSIEIEAALEKHAAIAEAAVVSMPHPRLGEGVAAFIRTRDSVELPSLTEIAQFLDEIGLARQKYPERLEYVDDFPRTVSGKIRKDQLREALRQPLIIHLDGTSQGKGRPV